MSKAFPVQIQTILHETEKQLHHIYASRLKEIILFGSYARGDFTEDSDIDLLLLIDGMTDLEAERTRYLPIISQLSLEFDTLISVIPYDVEEFRSKRTPLILNVLKEGMAL